MNVSPIDWSIEGQRLPFGKFKGQLVSRLPKKYCRWLLLAVDNLQPEIRSALKQRLNHR